MNSNVKVREKSTIRKKKEREREKEKIRTLEKEDASNGENVTNNIKSGLVCEG